MPTILSTKPQHLTELCADALKPEMTPQGFFLTDTSKKKIINQTPNVLIIHFPGFKNPPIWGLGTRGSKKENDDPHFNYLDMKWSHYQQSVSRMNLCESQGYISHD